MQTDMLILCMAMIALLPWLLELDLFPETVSGMPIPKPDKPEPKAWDKLLSFKKGGGSAPSADPNIGKAALKEAQLGEDWLKFARDQYATANQRQVGQDAIAKKVQEKQLATMDMANQWTKEDRATGQAIRQKFGAFGDEQMGRYKDTFRPIEDKIASDAMSWDSKDRMDEEAAKARNTVMANVDAQRQSRARELAGMGVKPGSGRSAGVQRADDINAALAASTAENQGRDTIRQQAQGMRGNAANLGANINAGGMQATNLGLAASGLGSTSAGLGLSAGTTALNTGLANNAAANNNAQIMGQGYQGAMSGYGNQANILNAQYGNQLSAWNAQQQSQGAGIGGLFSGLGSLAGAYMSMGSSRDYKEDKQPIDGALEVVKELPVESWKYKDGIEDGGQHIGTYAEDFQQATGLGDGKSIPVVDAIGLNMKAIQELSQKVDKLAKGRGLPKRKGASA